MPKSFLSKLRRLTVSRFQKAGIKLGERSHCGWGLKQRAAASTLQAARGWNQRPPAALVWLNGDREPGLRFRAGCHAARAQSKRWGLLSDLLVYLNVLNQSLYVQEVNLLCHHQCGTNVKGRRSSHRRKWDSLSFAIWCVKESNKKDNKHQTIVWTVDWPWMFCLYLLLSCRLGIETGSGETLKPASYLFCVYLCSLQCGDRGHMVTLQGLTGL